MKRISSLAGLSLAVCALAAASTQASTVAVGQLFAPSSPCPGTTTALQSSVSSGTSYVVPSSGLITSWSFQDAAATVTGLKLKVARPAGAVGSYTIVAESSAGTQTPSAVNTYQTSIPVQAGDILGIYASGTELCESTAGTTSADIAYLRSADEPPGSTMAYSPVVGLRFPVSATLQPTPGVFLINPTSGSIAGGTSVTVAGHDFTGATAVSFGGLPATSFTVGSDNQLTAVSSPSSLLGPVDVRVTTAAGTSPAEGADRFTYTGCVVPNLKGKKLKRAKKTLRKHDCKLGKVKPKGQKTGKVKKQRPRAGRVLPVGSEVNVKLG
jgi:hypothetical protein